MTSEIAAANEWRVAIFGSCVTRDVYALRPELGYPAAYFARSSMISAMHHVRVRDVATDALPSSFQRRMVENDLSKRIQRFLAKPGGFDLLIVDLIDERFQVLNTADGAWLTRSTEFTRLDTSRIKIRDRLAPHTPERLDLWRAGWRRFVDLLDAGENRSKVRINAVRWSDSVRNEAEFPAPYTDELIRQANESLDAMYGVMRDDLNADQFWEFDSETLVADPEHKWTIAPYHYVPEYYDALAERIARESQGYSLDG